MKTNFSCFNFKRYNRKSYPRFSNINVIGKRTIGVELRFFRLREPLKFLERGALPCRIETFKNVDGFIGQIISSGKASLNELKTVYTLEDALDIYEAEAITKYNEFLIAKASMKEK